MLRLRTILVGLLSLVMLPALLGCVASIRGSQRRSINTEPTYNRHDSRNHAISNGDKFETPSMNVG